MVDDTRFARELVADRAGRRLSGDRAVRYALLAKGVPGDVAAQAMEAAGEEGERGLALARKRVFRLSSLEPEAAYRRLYALLLRRGFGSSIAREACRQALREALPEAEEPE